MNPSEWNISPQSTPPDEKHQEAISADKTKMLSREEIDRLNERSRAVNNHYRHFQSFLIDVEEIEILRKFKIGEQLGRGRQGVVFEGHGINALDCHTVHALKVFDPTLFHTSEDYEQEMRRIARQVSMLQHLYHPNLVKCELFFMYQNLGVLLMELIEGIDIRRFIDYERHTLLYRRIPLEEWKHFNSALFDPEIRALQPNIVFYIIRKMLRGLEILHCTGYIHCDIKPSNIMIDRFGTVKIIDFGRATLISKPGMHFLASPMYMAPELHERRDITPLADIYSTGMVLLEMLYGKPLITTSATEYDIYEFKLQLPDIFPKFLPKRYRRNKLLHKIIRRFIAVDLNERFPSAHDAEAGTEGLIQMQTHYSRTEKNVDAGLELEIYLSRCLPFAHALQRPLPSQN
ncbi:MAG: serine/threonine-protein kinase [Lentisphaerae bacterium]|nr:MAG: serine/threonine-protein kinase [Lentisphaerota bacterium]